MRPVTHRSLFVPVMGLLTGLAWFALWAVERSPYGRYLDHGRWDRLGLQESLCRIIPAGDVLVLAALYVAGWTVMVSAMMLPTALPLLEIFRRLTARRQLLALLIAGYLGIWGLFGVAAHLVDLGLHALVAESLWLTLNAWVLGAGVLGLAGLFQFSPLKHHCLDRCRMPLGFVIEHWRGSRTRWQALLLGVHHGVFCVGCCWALMLLMFVVGTGSIGWMLLLDAVMAAEKNLPWGRRLSAPLGVGLIGWAAVVTLQQLRPWPM